jgi:hypothetical protein
MGAVISALKCNNPSLAWISRQISINKPKVETTSYGKAGDVKSRLDRKGRADRAVACARRGQIRTCFLVRRLFFPYKKSPITGLQKKYAIYYQWFGNLNSNASIIIEVI